MEENLRCRAGKFGLVLSFVLWAMLVTGVRGQTTNVINLCTEEALRAYVALGGVYQVGDCGTNASVLNILLTQPLVVEKDFTLVSTQQVLLNGQSLTRLMIVKPGVKVSLQNILFFSGRQTETNANDGGIPDTAGAAIYNDGGSITIRDGRFEANAVVGITGSAGGAGTGRSGEPGGDAAGGAIFNKGGQLWLSNTVFVANSAAGGPGGQGGSGAGNAGLGGTGGNGGAGGTGAGAAIYSRGGSIAIYASTFNTNTATGAQAGAGGAATGFLGFTGAPGEAGDAIGGAIGGDNTEITVYGCTFYQNKLTAANGIAGNNGVRNKGGDKGQNGGDAAGAAIYSTGRLSVTNCTFSANAAVSGNGGVGGAGGGSGFGADGGNGGNGGSATGGAIESIGGGVVVNCTFADNAATSGSGGAAGAGAGVGETGDAGTAGFTSGGALYARDAEVIIANNILANSTTTVGGSVQDRGGNLSTDVNPLITNPASFRLTNPYLKPLATNGGPTMTMAIATNSPAVNAGVADFCPPFDQRGSNRVAQCDIGAFETTALSTNAPLPDIPTNVINGLSVSLSTNTVTLQWPSGFTNLYLQFTTNLVGTNTTWSLAPQSATINQTNNVVEINPSLAEDRRLFFRLFYGRTNQ